MNTRNWTLLLEAISQKRVVIVLGDELFTIVDESGARIKVTDYVKQQLLQKFPLRFPDSSEDADFSTIEEQIELSNYLNRGNNDSTNIYFEVYHILKDKQIECKGSIKRLLSLKQFPLILSTSFIQQIPSLFNISEEKVHCYKKSSTNDLNPDCLSSFAPALYYMFGRANSLSRSYMVTEEDYLDYLHHWHNSEFRPQNLCRYLSNKFLLVLGCNYPNWIFRFFWHSMRNFNLPSHSSFDTEGIVSVENSNDYQLRRFLARIQTQVCENVDAFVDELIENWNSTTGSQQTAESDEQSSEVDFFISYASEDYDVAKAVADIFTSKGARVWFDKRELTPGNEYEGIIKNVITHAKRFVPIISNNTLIEERRFFRKEWSLALGEKAFRLNMEFIIPVRIDSFPISSDLLPDEFKETHFLDFTQSQETFENEVVGLIRKIRR